MQLDPTPKSYCDCWSYGKSQKSTSECKCGDEDSRELEWVWRPSEHPTVKVMDEVSVMFHPVYSQGTGIVSSMTVKCPQLQSKSYILPLLQVRGDSPLQAGRHHFWEIKMTSTVCGTDLMIGVGTEKVDLLANKYRFASALGLDTNSWGYSYRGIAQHDNESKFYGKKFGTGSIVSCHLDLFRGTIEFYMNRMPLGVAFRNLPVDGSHVYYPMVSSTAAKSSVKLLNASSFPECLQYQTMRAISRHPGTLSQLRGLPTGFRYKDQLWYLQRTEKFIYNVEALRKDPIFDQRTGFEGTAYLM